MSTNKWLALSAGIFFTQSLQALELSGRITTDLDSRTQTHRLALTGHKSGSSALVRTTVSGTTQVKHRFLGLGNRGLDYVGLVAAPDIADLSLDYSGLVKPGKWFGTRTCNNLVLAGVEIKGQYRRRPITGSLDLSSLDVGGQSSQGRIKRSFFLKHYVLNGPVSFGAFELKPIAPNSYVFNYDSNFKGDKPVLHMSFDFGDLRVTGQITYQTVTRHHSSEGEGLPIDSRGSGSSDDDDDVDGGGESRTTVHRGSAGEITERVGNLKLTITDHNNEALLLSNLSSPVGSLDFVRFVKVDDDLDLAGSILPAGEVSEVSLTTAGEGRPSLAEHLKALIAFLQLMSLDLPN